MIKCRLKIIASNIINDIDTPEIKYISKNENMKISYDNDEEINQNEMNELDEINYNNNLENNKHNNINKLDNLQQIDELINIELANYNKIENNNSKINDNKNIDSNELYTISNQHIYDDNYYSANISNYNTISNFYKQESKSNSFHMNDSKRNESNLSLKYIFRKREHKNYRNRSFSNKFSDDKKEKKYNLIKDIFKTHPVNYTNMKILSKNKEKNKVGNILNININKSFCINNNIKINHKNITQKNLSKNKSQKKGSGKNSKTKKQIKLEQIKEYKNVMKKVKPLKFSKRTNKNKSLNDITNASVAWYYVENNDMNNEQGKNYKILIDELRVKEMDLIQEKEKIIQTYEEKLKPLRELNSKLINENSEELNKEDELRGELVILKNQYERLIKTNKNNNSKKDNNIIMNNNKGLDDNNKEKIIEQEIDYLNEKLNKGEILLIAKPPYEIKISEQEDKNMVLMLKGLFYSIHIRDTDRIVDLVWKSDKQIQTIYFLVNEIMKLFNLKNSEKNLLINFFYSFCKKYKYIDINEFKKEFKEKIGDIPLYNNKIYISKLLNFNGTKMIELIKLMKEKDTFNLGFLTLDQVNALLNNLCLSFDSEKDFNDIYEFIMITMKKDRSFNLFDDNDTNNINEQENTIKFSLFDLFYQSLIDLIEEFDYNIIYNPFDSIRNYMQKNEINNAELLLKPLLNNKYIIKINNKEYFDIEILNKYLRKLGIIQLNESIYINCYEEELVDKNKFIDDINDYGINETKETDLNKLNQNVNDLINGIFDNYQ
jgi:hypothetical protein